MQTVHLWRGAQKGFETGVRELVTNHPMLRRITASMLLARATLQREHNRLHKALRKIVRRDKVCWQFMTVPSVGQIVAIIFKTAVDDSSRINKSKAVGPVFGFTRQEVPIGRGRCDRRHHADRRCDGSCDAL